MFPIAVNTLFKFVFSADQPQKKLFTRQNIVCKVGYLRLVTECGRIIWVVAGVSLNVQKFEINLSFLPTGSNFSIRMTAESRDC